MTALNQSAAGIDRRDFFATGTAGLAMTGFSPLLQADTKPTRLRFGLNADPHLQGPRPAGRANKFKRFVDQMLIFRPDFAIDLGDFGIQISEGKTTQKMHDGQIAGLKHHVGEFARLKCPRYHVMGNHDVGWLKGGEEKITAAELIGHSHAGEDITKQDFLEITGAPHRYYSFDVHGFHFIVLDANNGSDESSPPRGKDGLGGAYWIDATQKQWLDGDLAKHRHKPKLVFCHEELHHTPEAGSGHGGDTPFKAVGKQNSYVDNGWEIRKMFAQDGRVLACFFGHKHRSRWTVYDDTHYLTMAATHFNASFAEITIDKNFAIKGFGSQRSYKFPLPKWLSTS